MLSSVDSTGIKPIMKCYEHISQVYQCLGKAVFLYKLKYKLSKLEWQAQSSTLMNISFQISEYKIVQNTQEPLINYNQKVCKSVPF